jgi:hypothetical protein
MLLGDVDCRAQSLGAAPSLGHYKPMSEAQIIRIDIRIWNSNAAIQNEASVVLVITFVILFTLKNVD